MRRWRATLSELLRDLGLIAWCVGWLLLVRMGLMIALHSHMGPRADAVQWLMTLLGGIRFDGRVSVIAAGASVVMTLALAGAWPTAARRVRLISATVFASATALIGICDYFYFLEYGDQFNQFLMGVIYDDRHALASTIWQSYPVIQVGMGAIIGTWLISWIWRRMPTAWLPHEAWWQARSWPSLLALSFGIIIGLVVVARGSISRLPAQQKFAAITHDATLNKLVRNPWDSLNTALSDHAALASPNSVSSADVSAAAGRFFKTPVTNLDQATTRIAMGSSHPPRHIILVVMESQSGWTLLPAWRDLDLNPGLTRLATEGAFSERFLSAGSGTIESLGTLITGIPASGLMAGYQPLARRAFPSSIAPIFKELGYRTRFIYSGYLSWQRLGDLAATQGFDEIHGGAEMGNWLVGGEWGVDDEVCYSYAAQTISDASPSFTLILTTSNHPPFAVDVHAKGFPQPHAPASVTNGTDADWKILGHLWYGDRCVERFVRDIATKLTQPLIAITGDHYGRRFPNDRPDARERTGVPLILWGPGIIAPATHLGPGSHLDLLPTLIERAAPAGFTYHAWGQDLLGPNAPQLVVARNTAVSASEWVDLGETTPVPPPGSWVQLHSDLTTVGWWRLVRGPIIDH